MTFTFWIQKSDLSVAIDDEVVTSAAQVLSVFDTFNWQAELDNLKESESTGDENCPAGLGIVKPNGEILHLCPNPDKTVLAIWHHRVPYKLFGFIKITRINLTTDENLALQTAREAINRFIKEDDNWLLSNINQSFK